jgi:hypothetical protein
MIVDQDFSRTIEIVWRRSHVVANVDDCVKIHPLYFELQQKNFDVARGASDLRLNLKIRSSSPL